MKLGDNMAPIEACNVWNDVCPRKTRPPKIGDIPRHVAVDEESPGSSTSRSVTQVQEASTAAGKSTLERSAISHAEHGKAAASSARGALPALETFARPPPSSKRLEQLPRRPVELGRAETPKRSSNSSIPPAGTFNGPAIFSEISATLRAEKNQQLQLEPLEKNPKNPSVQLSGSIGGDTTKFHEDEIPGEIIQVRKDSALYIDEKSDEAAELRDSLVAIAVSPRSAGLTAGIIDQQVEEAVNSRLARPRARRESSGYFSNLGTFDEDRWAGGSSGAELASQQQDRRDSLSTRDSHRGRSSAKNRVSMGGGQQVNRMTSLVCPASEETVVSTLDGDAAKGRIEMPNIDEQTSLELNKSVELDRNADKTPPEIEAETRGEAAPIPRGNSPPSLETKSRAENSAKPNVTPSELEDEMRDRIARISLGNSSSNTRDPKSRVDSSAEPDEMVLGVDGEMRKETARISWGNSSSKTREPKSRAENSEGLDVKLPEMEDEMRDRTAQISLLGNSSKTRTSNSRAQTFAIVEKTGGESSRNVDEPRESTGKLGSVDQVSQSQWTTTSRAASRQRSRMVVHQYSSPNITNSELSRIVERPHSENFGRSTSEFQRPDATNSNVINVVSPTEDAEEEEEDDDDDNDNEQVVAADLGGSERSGEGEADARKLLPRSIKVYQLLSTQSEDRGDGDTRLFDRRISLQIPRQEEEATRENARLPTISAPTVTEYVEEKKLVHADSVPILKIPSSDSTTVENELRLCAGGRTPGSGHPSGPTIPGIRPIYPYCPYSPYASPQGSPRTNRRRPLRESRRVSIDSRQGALQLNQYKLLNNIGQGSYGIVKLAYNEEDETHYAMKILSKKKLMKKAGIFGRIAPGRKGVANPLAKVYREIALLKKLDHPNVVKLVEVLDDPDEDNLYLVFELVQRGEVLQLPAENPLDEETARIHFRDVVMGVEYLHYQRIVHRDIKPSNLLVDSEGRVKVADLGVSAELRAAGELLSGSAGTPAFAAPETTTPGAQYSGTLCDVWSMGVTLYSLVTGKVPWDGAGSIIGVQSAVRTEPLRFPESPRLSDDLRDLVSRMLAKDPARRITLAEIKEHPWLTKQGEEPLPNEADNCRLPVTVTDEEVARVVTRVPKLDTLILIKTMLKQHSFQNPFLPRRIVRSGCTTVDPGTSGSALKQQASSDTTDSSTELLPTVETLKSKTEQFHKAGRSNSAPDSYEWQTNGRQISSDSLLPPVTESSSQEQQAEVEKR